MNDLPRKRIEPLAPPPGEFDRVVARARYRRQKHYLQALMVLAVFVAGVGGGVAIGRDVPRQVAILAGLTDGDSTSSATPEPADGEAATRTRTKDRDRTTRGGSATALPAATQPTHRKQTSAVFRGRAVGPAGRPAAGIYVYVGRPDAATFVPNLSASAMTGKDGRFTIPCPDGPVLLAPWPVLSDAKAKARRVNLAATFVGGVTDPALAPDVTCRRAVQETTLGRGNAVQGEVHMPETCPTDEISMWVWIDGVREVHVKVQDLRDGDHFRVSGLPPGRHVLGANGNLQPVTVGGGRTSVQDVTFFCESARPATGGPMSSPTPTSTASPTGSPSGTASPTETSSPSTETTTPEPSISPTP